MRATFFQKNADLLKNTKTGRDICQVCFVTLVMDGKGKYGAPYEHWTSYREIRKPHCPCTSG